MQKGKVYLIGAGPSDAGLLTLKGKEVLEKADVVVYDALVSPEILTFIKDTAKTINVGKRANNHAKTQDEINHILLEEAQKDRVVARLKGGDPFLFGRGGEELELLVEHNIPFEVIPGVTSSIAVPAYNGIPVTHRDCTSSVHIITGHRKENSLRSIDFSALVNTGGTLVFLMGRAALEGICEGLLLAGIDKDTPAALLENGTTAKQRKVIATVETLAQKAKDFTKTPAIIVVGDVCSYANQFDFYEKLPLFGKHVLVPRPLAMQSTLSTRLSELGAQVLSLPTIKIVPFELNNDKILTQTFENLDVYNWIVLTSPSGVSVFFNTLQKANKDIRSVAHCKFAVLGNGTKKALMEKGIFADIAPTTFNSENLLEQIIAKIPRSNKILLPRAKKGDPHFSEKLRENGYLVNDVAIYDTVNADNDLFKEHLSKVDYVMFTSASSVKGYMEMVGEKSNPPIIAICIGEKTATVARNYGLDTYVSKQATLDSMIELLKTFK